MDQQGYLSLWIGEIQNGKNLAEYIELVYTDDGDFLPFPL